MFLPYIVTFIMLLISFTLLATGNSFTKASETKINFTKVKFVYPREEVLTTGVENLCQADASYCQDKYDSDSDTITLSLSDLDGYIPTGFLNNNGLGGSFGNIIIADNNSTIKINQNIDKDSARYVYLHYYVGAKYGTYPKCLSGNADDKSPCDSSDVVHSYPTSLDLRIALAN